MDGGGSRTKMFVKNCIKLRNNGDRELSSDLMYQTYIVVTIVTMILNPNRLVRLWMDVDLEQK